MEYIVSTLVSVKVDAESSEEALDKAHLTLKKLHNINGLYVSEDYEAKLDEY